MVRISRIRSRENGQNMSSDKGMEMVWEKAEEAVDMGRGGWEVENIQS
jgi:hypothetical protein